MFYSSGDGDRLPDVTVVIPAYNGSLYLATTIASLLAQTHRDFRMFVVDDRSDDNSVAIARAFEDPRLTVTMNAERRGLAGNWNVAQSLATTSYLLIAHQDDVYSPDFLARMTRLLDEHPRAFIAHSRVQYLDGRGRTFRPAAARFKDRFWPEDDPYEREPAAELAALQGGNYIVCPSVLYRSSAVRAIGRFNESLTFVPDWEYWIRGLSQGFSIVGTHEQLLQWRRHETTATSREEATLRRYDEELALLEWIARETPLETKLSAVENTLLSDFASHLARGDEERAAALYDYARRRLPASHMIHAVMRTGMMFGRPGGFALRLAESAYTRVGRPR